MEKRSILTFTAAFLVGAIGVFFLKPFSSKQSLKNLNEGVRTLPLEEIATRIVKASELNDQRFVLMLLPELKRNLIQENPNLVKTLNSDKFWESFQTQNDAKLRELDQKVLNHVATSLHSLRKEELLEYLNLKESPEVKTIQQKINIFMPTQFQQEINLLKTKYHKLAEDYYVTQKSKETAPPVPAPISTPTPAEIK